MEENMKVFNKRCDTIIAKPFIYHPNCCGACTYRETVNKVHYLCPSRTGFNDILFFAASAWCQKLNL